MRPSENPSTRPPVHPSTRAVTRAGLPSRPSEPVAQPRASSRPKTLFPAGVSWIVLLFLTAPAVMAQSTAPNSYWWNRGGKGHPASLTKDISLGEFHADIGGFVEMKRWEKAGHPYGPYKQGIQSLYFTLDALRDDLSQHGLGDMQPDYQVTGPDWLWATDSWYLRGFPSGAKASTNPIFHPW